MKAIFVTTNEHKRREVQEILMKDLPTIPLVEYGDTNVARARVQNIFKSLSSHERWDEVWVTDGK